MLARWLCRRLFKLQHVLAVLCVGGVASLGAAGDDAQPEGANKPGEMWTSRGHMATAGASYYVISVPHPIGEEEWDMYATELVLSEAQGREFRRLYGAYLVEDRAYRAESIQPLWERSGKIAASNDLYTNEATAKRFAELMSDRAAALPGLLAIENRLFEGVAAYLSEEQLDLMEHVRNQRRRARCNAAHCRFPGSMIDLSRMLYRASEEGLDLTPADPEMFRMLLDEYDWVITPLFERRLKLNLRTQVEGNVLMARAAELWAVQGAETETKAAAEELDRQRRALNRGEIRTARRIQELNRMYLALLAAELPADTRRELIDRFNGSTYPVVYPDPYDAHAVFEAALAMPDLSDKQRGELKSALELYRVQQGEVTDRMLRQYLDWKQRTGVVSGYGFDEYDAYSEAMRKLQGSRQAVADMALAMLREALTESQQADLTPELAAWEDRASAFEAHDALIQERFQLAGWQWPRPYD